MTTLVFYSGNDRYDSWAETLTRLMPKLVLRDWNDPGDDSEVVYALVWNPPPGALKRRFSNLRCIFSLGAGVDALLDDPDLPEGIPVVRMVEDSLIVGMTEFIVLHVLRHHRRQRELHLQQAARIWAPMPTPLAPQRRVGVMGLGMLGRDAVRALSALRFDVGGWSRSPRATPGIRTYHGRDGLGVFLAATDILVVLLPHTLETRGILNRDLFAQLPKGACLVNAGRGALQVEVDILAALDSGQLAEATLDVFETEPLPEDSPLWHHPGVTISPHIASVTSPASGAEEVVNNIRRIEAGDPPRNLVDRDRGY